MARRLTIGTRGSDLALFQADFIKNILTIEHNCEVDRKIIKTAGDIIDNISFDKMEGNGFFTKEIEDALLSGEIDIAVHSLKDLMTTQPSGLKLGAVGYRADRRELLLVRKDSFTDNGLLSVKDGGTIGTSSARRQCQIAFCNPKLEIKDLRGNVPTRVNKLLEGQYDAILIAAAGVERLALDLSGLVAIALDEVKFLPAPAQGLLGIQIRSDDAEIESLVSRLGSDEDFKIATLERGLLKKFGGGCSLPLGVFSELNGDKMILIAVLGVRDGDSWRGLKRVSVSGSSVDLILDKAHESLMTGEVCHA